MYIKQSNTNNDDLVVVDTTDFVGDLSTHPSVVENPTLFEVVNDELPETYTTLIYQSPTPAPLKGQQVEIGGVMYTLSI